MEELRIFETHAHYDDRAYDEDRDELLSSMPSMGIDTIINIAADLKSCDTTYELTEKYEYVYGAIGIHPESVRELALEPNSFDHVRELASMEKIVAVGEIGLDYHYEGYDKALQREWFERQLKLAKDINKPVVIHSRDACEDTIDILVHAGAGIKGVMHCYSYSKETAMILLKAGFYFGIGGVVTFSNARKLVETVEAVPLDKILLETDCPYLAPVPYRGKRNDSGRLKEIAMRIATVKGISYEDVVETTYNNARELFFGNNKRGK